MRSRSRRRNTTRGSHASVRRTSGSDTRLSSRRTSPLSKADDLRLNRDTQDTEKHGDHGDQGENGHLAVDDDIGSIRRRYDGTLKFSGQGDFATDGQAI